MTQLKKFILLLLIVAAPAISMAENAKDKMVKDLDIIKSTFEVKYAPKEWKKSFADWDLEDQITQAKIKVVDKKGITVKDYQQILKEFFNSTKDYHVGVQFFSTEFSLLPFRIQGAGGKYYVAHVEPWIREAPKWSKIPLKVGDEIVMVDGKKTDHAVRQFKLKEFGNPDSETDQTLAEGYFTYRSGISGHQVPQGPVSLSVLHKGSKKAKSYRPDWIYFPEEIHSDQAMNTYITQQNTHLPLKKGASGLGTHPFFSKDMSSIHAKLWLQKEKNAARLKYKAADDGFIGSQNGFLPDLGEVVWRAPLHYNFRAYIYKNEKGDRIGFVRIPTFLCGAKDANEFADIMTVFEGQADALVIDQTNNEGGDLFYMYALASMLTDKPLLVPAERMTITQEDVFFALKNLPDLEDIKTTNDAKKMIGSSLSGLPVDLEIAKKFVHYFHFIIDQWNQGNVFTEADYVYGIDYLNPHPKGHFTKPILFLVNSLDFSCADFLPAILQDNGRVTVMGTRTAGAGGFVLGHSYPNMFGVAGYSFTGSIAQRLDFSPIENLGVSPDIEYQITEKDLQENFSDFVHAINEQVGKL